MNLVLALSELYIPTPVKRRFLRELFTYTAAAFRREPPPMERSFAGSLHAYALFTREMVEDVLPGAEDEQVVRERLYQNACRLGLKLRRSLHPATSEEVRRAIHLLYRVLGIEAGVDQEGVLTVRSCFFSAFYTGCVCRFISALDAGVIAGLSGGKRLVFSQRITEGGDCCLARLESGV